MQIRPYCIATGTRAEQPAHPVLARNVRWERHHDRVYVDADDSPEREMVVVRAGLA